MMRRVIALSFVMAAWAGTASAQGGDVRGFEAVLTSIEGALGLWETRLLPHAQSLFLGLATIDLALLLILSMLRGEGEGLAWRFARRLIVLLVLFNFIAWAPGLSWGTGAQGVIDSFMMIGRDASGMDGIRPSSFLVAGIKLFTAYAVAVMKFAVNPLNAALYGQALALSTALVGLAMAFVAATGAFIVIESYVTVSGGFLLLGFMGSEVTKDAAQVYPTAVLRAGVKLLIVHMMLGVGFELIEIWTGLVRSTASLSFKMFLSVAVSAALYAVLVWRLPRMMAELVPNNAVDLKVLYA